MIEKPWYSINKYEICQSYKDVFIQHGSTHHVTFIFNPHDILPRECAEKTLHEWHKRVDKVLYGDHFYKFCRNDRTSFIAVAEHMDSNFHYHAVLKTPNIKKFGMVGKLVWKDLVPSGELHISKERTIEGWADYMSKDLMKGSNLEAMFFSYAREQSKSINSLTNSK